MTDKSERRNVTRETSMIEGYAVYGRVFKRTVPCLITERSGRGARLWTNSLANLPDRFRLFVGPTDEVGHDVVNVWRNGAELGVAFQPERSARSYLTFSFSFGRPRTA